MPKMRDLPSGTKPAWLLDESESKPGLMLPKGVEGPEKTLPPLRVPIRVSTYEAGSLVGACAASLTASNALNERAYGTRRVRCMAGVKEAVAA